MFLRHHTTHAQDLHATNFKILSDPPAIHRSVHRPGLGCPQELDLSTALSTGEPVPSRAAASYAQPRSRAVRPSELGELFGPGPGPGPGPSPAPGSGPGRGRQARQCGLAQHACPVSATIRVPLRIVTAHHTTPTPAPPAPMPFMDANVAYLRWLRRKPTNINARIDTQFPTSVTLIREWPRTHHHSHPRERASKSVGYLGSGGVGQPRLNDLAGLGGPAPDRGRLAGSRISTWSGQRGVP